MFDFFVNNLSTIIVGILVAALLLAVVIKMIKDKKQGKSSCGCHCSGCPGAGTCHSDQSSK
ncbi:MAG: FeoB-associated Cys-rich membrane protein [Clostridium sp.]